MDVLTAELCTMRLSVARGFCKLSERIERIADMQVTEITEPRMECADPAIAVYQLASMHFRHTDEMCKMNADIHELRETTAAVTAAHEMMHFERIGLAEQVNEIEEQTGRDRDALRTFADGVHCTAVEELNKLREVLDNHVSYTNTAYDGTRRNFDTMNHVIEMLTKNICGIDLEVQEMKAYRLATKAEQLPRRAELPSNETGGRGMVPAHTPFGAQRGTPSPSSPGRTCAAPMSYSSGVANVLECEIAKELKEIHMGVLVVSLVKSVCSMLD